MPLTKRQKEILDYITGFIDELITYSNNTSNFDGDLHRTRRAGHRSCLRVARAQLQALAIVA